MEQIAGIGKRLVMVRVPAACADRGLQLRYRPHRRGACASIAIQMRNGLVSKPNGSGRCVWTADGTRGHGDTSCSGRSDGTVPDEEVDAAVGARLGTGVQLLACAEEQSRGTRSRRVFGHDHATLRVNPQVQNNRGTRPSLHWGGPTVRKYLAEPLEKKS